MNDLTIGSILMLVYFVVGFSLLGICALIVNHYWPEQEQTIQTTNQQLTVIHNETATRRTRRTNKAA